MIGIDLIKIDRMKKLIEKYDNKFLEKFLSPQEILLVKNHRTAAGFWAAKEAASKALGCGIGAECGFHDITITKTAKGAPLLDLSTKVKQHFNIQTSALSITHDGDYAIAVVTHEKI
ncbi:MAG: holo-ACP synthase [Campylobacterota bacterium]